MGTRDEIGDDEFIYRKISVNSGWYDPVRDEVKPFAFKPFLRESAADSDITGISVDRAYSEQRPEFRRIEVAAQGRSRNGYYVAVLRVGDCRAQGIKVEPRPLPENPGHAELPDLASDHGKTARAKEIMEQLANELTLEVHGPFVKTA